jgi:hypothetical protein
MGYSKEIVKKAIDIFIYRHGKFSLPNVFREAVTNEVSIKTKQKKNRFAKNFNTRQN